MIDKTYLKMTSEQRKISARNKKLARKYFGIENKSEYVLHHKDTSLRKNDLDRYVQWYVDDLEVMNISDHISLHHKGKTISKEQAKMQSQRMMGHTPWNKGMSGVYHLSDEAKKNISEGHKGIKCSEEKKAKISKANKGTNHWNEEARKHHGEVMRKQRTGYKLSEETKRKISESHKGKKKNYSPWNKGKKYKKVDGKIIFEA